MIAKLTLAYWEYGIDATKYHWSVGNNNDSSVHFETEELCRCYELMTHLRVFASVSSPFRTFWNAINTIFYFPKPLTVSATTMENSREMKTAWKGIVVIPGGGWSPLLAYLYVLLLVSGRVNVLAISVFGFSPSGRFTPSLYAYSSTRTNINLR